MNAYRYHGYMLHDVLKTMTTLLVGLLVTFLGAIVGSVLFSIVIIGGHITYTAAFVKDAIRDGQWEGFAMIGTVPYGALLGSIATAANVAISVARRGEVVTGALFCLSGGLLPMVSSGVLIYFFTRDDYDDKVAMLTIVGIPFLASICLFGWGLLRLIRFHRQAT